MAAHAALRAVRSDTDSRRLRVAKFIAVTGFAVALGIYSDVGRSLPGKASLIPSIAAPWIIVAYFAGSLVRRPFVSPAAGSLIVMTGLGSYVAFKCLAYGPDSVQQFVRYDSTRWAVLGIVVGMLFGGAGALLRLRPRMPAAVSIALLGGALVAEGVATTIGSPFYYAAPTGPVEMALGVLVCCLGAWKTRWVIVAATAPTVAAAGMVAPILVLSFVRPGSFSE